ncbi:MAG TPA: N-acetyltransferase [Vicinamibacterales bacterium]|nr:N-acetyltransferase [Vicinamibacterales bacterium]
MVQAKAFTVRREKPGDEGGIRHLNEEAFGQPDEARLVDALRLSGRQSLSLVAVASDGTIVGHALFTPVRLEGSSMPLMGLGPMAVLPAWQRSGIGSRLVTSGLEECADSGSIAVVVVGHAGYYPRFGFVRASLHGLRCEYDVPDDVFMVKELVPGALAGRSGLVRYPIEFGTA